MLFFDKSLRWMALRRSHFQCGNMQGEGHLRVPQPEGPPPAPPPSWARKEFCVVVCATLLTFVCMLRYSEWNVVPIWFLDSSIFMVVYCADLVPGFWIMDSESFDVSLMFFWCMLPFHAPAFFLSSSGVLLSILLTNPQKHPRLHPPPDRCRLPLAFLSPST